MSPEQMKDVLDCGTTEQVWTLMVAYLDDRSRQSEDIAEELRREAQDALTRADEHFAEAQEFHNLALSMKRSPVTSAPQADGAAKANEATNQQRAKAPKDEVEG